MPEEIYNDTMIPVTLTIGNTTHFIASVSGPPKGPEWASIVKAVAHYASGRGTRILTPPRPAVGSGNPRRRTTVDLMSGSGTSGVHLTVWADRARLLVVDLTDAQMIVLLRGGHVAEIPADLFTEPVDATNLAPEGHL